MLFRLIVLGALAAGCASPLDCDEALPAGPSGGELGSTLTICVRDESGAALAGADVRVDNVDVATTDATGRAEIDASGPADFLVVATGRLSRAIFGASRPRFTLALPVPASGTRRVEGTVSGLSALPAPPAGARRTLEARVSTVVTPGAVADALAGSAVEVCVVSGDECTFSFDAPSRAGRVGLAVIDEVTMSGRTVVAFAVSDALSDVPLSIAIPAGVTVSDVTLSGAGVDAVVGVPGVGVDGQALFFGAGSSLTNVAVPAEGGTSWLAVIYRAEMGSVSAGITQDVPAMLAAPVAPMVSAEGDTTLVLGGATRYTSVSLLSASGGELWRGTILDGRARVEAPLLLADRVAVITHGETPRCAEECGAVSVVGVVSAPLP